MFTGLVAGLAQVVDIVSEPPGVVLRLRYASFANDAEIGESIAINGCCLTVVGVDGDTFSFEAGAETLSRTNLGEFQPGDHVNVERALCTGDPIGGHYVTGHIDAVGTLLSRETDGEWCTMWFSMPERLAGQLASKGSIAVDGVSLTLVDVEADRFSVALIPHTLEVTTLGARNVGDRVNLETDVLAKYVQRQLEFLDIRADRDKHT